MSNTNGSKWVRPTTRKAIYLRDGHACVVCGAENAPLTLDHVRPRALGGTNAPSNLITTCLRCNSARQAKPLADFVWARLAYAFLDAITRQYLYAVTMDRIERARRRQPRRKQALAWARGVGERGEVQCA